MRKNRLFSICLLAVLLLGLLIPCGAEEVSFSRETALKVKDFYSSTLEGMAGRRLYVYGLIGGVSDDELSDAMLGIERPLTRAAAKALFSRLCCGDEEIRQEIETILDGGNDAVGRETFIQALQALTGQEAAAAGGGESFTRGDAFYLLSKAMDATVGGSGQTLKERLQEQGALQYRDEVLTPERLVITAATLEEVMAKLEEAMEFVPRFVSVQAPAEVLDAFLAMNQDDRDDRLDGSGTEQYLFDSCLSEKSMGLKAYLDDDGLMIELLYNLSQHLYIHADAQDWLRYYKDPALANAYNAFMREKVLPLKAQYTSDRDLVEAVQRLICDNAQYDYTAAEKMDFTAAQKNGQELTAIINETADTHSIVGFLKDGKIVCDGYAETFYCCMRELGFECIQVFGYVSGAAHAWNKVRLSDGNWYNVDVCWDDTGNSSYSTAFFLKSDNTFRSYAHTATNYLSRFYSAAADF